jgi:hypothetical protein
MRCGSHQLAACSWLPERMTLTLSLSRRWWWRPSRLAWCAALPASRMRCSQPPSHDSAEHAASCCHVDSRGCPAGHRQGRRALRRPLHAVQGARGAPANPPSTAACAPVAARGHATPATRALAAQQLSHACTKAHVAAWSADPSARPHRICSGGAACGSDAGSLTLRMRRRMRACTSCGRVLLRCAPRA